jgi:SEL1 protein
VLYLKGIGVKRDVIRACNLFLHAVNAGQPKAIYQVAKLFQKGIGLKRNLHMVTTKLQLCLFNCE